MNTFDNNLIPLVASAETAQTLDRISDKFDLDEKQRSLQARILGKLFTKAITVQDLPRVLRINLLLSEKKAQELAAMIRTELLATLPSDTESNPTPPFPNTAEPSPIRSQEKAQVVPAGSKAARLRAWVDILVAELNLQLSDLQLSRLESAFLTYLKDVRDLLETKDVLLRPEERGGVGLSLEQSREVVRRLEKDFPDQDKGAQPLARRNAIFTNQRRIEQSETAALPEITRPLQSAKLEPPLAKDSGRATEQPQEASPSSLKTAFAKAGSVLRDIVAGSEPSPKRQLISGLSIAEIKNIEQIQEMGIQDFVSDPQKAERDLVEKVVKLVGKEETKRIAVVRNWRESALYKLYVEIGEQSITQGKTVADLTRERQAQGKPFLTQEEFNALADLSREFQY